MRQAQSRWLRVCGVPVAPPPANGAARADCCGLAGLIPARAVGAGRLLTLLGWTDLDRHWKSGPGAERQSSRLTWNLNPGRDSPGPWVSPPELPVRGDGQCRDRAVGPGPIWPPHMVASAARRGPPKKNRFSSRPDGEAVTQIRANKPEGLQMRCREGPAVDKKGGERILAASSVGPEETRARKRAYWDSQFNWETCSPFSPLRNVSHLRASPAFLTCAPPPGLRGQCEPFPRGRRKAPAHDGSGGEVACWPGAATCSHDDLGRGKARIRPWSGCEGRRDRGSGLGGAPRRRLPRAWVGSVLGAARHLARTVPADGRSCYNSAQSRKSVVFLGTSTHGSEIRQETFCKWCPGRHPPWNREAVVHVRFILAFGSDHQLISKAVKTAGYSRAFEVVNKRVGVPQLHSQHIHIFWFKNSSE